MFLYVAVLLVNTLKVSSVLMLHVLQLVACPAWTACLRVYDDVAKLVCVRSGLPKKKKTTLLHKRQNVLSLSHIQYVLHALCQVLFEPAWPHDVL